MRRTADEPLFNSLMEQHHYLGYEQPVGEHLKYLVWAQGRPIACLAWSSAPRHLGSRDRYIGWSAEARRRNIRFIAYNTRFLILPWVRVPHLASHILGRMAARISDDWERMYGHPIYFLETFVDPERFRGTCYRAANWVLLGQTTGRGKTIQQLRAEPLDQRGAGISVDQAVSRVAGASRMKPATTPDRREPGRTGPGAGRSAASAAERSRWPEAQRLRCMPWRRCWCGRGTRRRPAPCWEMRQARKPARADSRIPASRRRPDTGAMVPRRLPARRQGRRSRTRRCMHGDRCPECGAGNVYGQKEPETLVRIRGTGAAGGDRVFELERLRCNACGQVFTAEEPEGSGSGEVRRDGGRR